jgi:DNA-binding GntR family transcriptional regulator
MAARREGASAIAGILRPLAFDTPQPIWSAVYSVLRDCIVDLRLPPRFPLSEKDIAEVLGVSRTPVREALIRLSEEGLIDIYPQYGTFVAPMRISYINDAYFIRDSLECSIIAKVAAEADPALIGVVEDLIAQQSAAADAHDYNGFYALDERMHQAFSVACGREAVWRFIQNAKIHLDRVRRLILPHDLQVRRPLDEHRQILAALKAGSAEQAVAAMKHHIAGFYRRLPQTRERHPEMFEP